jgi:hypothetical protein
VIDKAVILGHKELESRTLSARLRARHWVLLGLRFLGCSFSGEFRFGLWRAGGLHYMKKVDMSTLRLSTRCLHYWSYAGSDIFAHGHVVELRSRTHSESSKYVAFMT